MVRKFIKFNGNKYEVNIFGKARKGQKEIYIIGEAKSRLSKKHINKLMKLIDTLEKSKVITKNRFIFTITYLVEPEVEEYAKARGVEVIWSYEV